jgi:hypothetical protein
VGARPDQEARDALGHTLLGHLQHMLLSSQSACLAVDDNGHVRHLGSSSSDGSPTAHCHNTHQQNQRTSPATNSTAPIDFAELVGKDGGTSKQRGASVDDGVALLAVGCVTDTDEHE